MEMEWGWGEGRIIVVRAEIILFLLSSSAQMGGSAVWVMPFPFPISPEFDIRSFPPLFRPHRFEGLSL